MKYNFKYWLTIIIVELTHFLFKKKVKVVNKYSDGQGVVEYQEHLKLFKRVFIYHWAYGSSDYRIIKEANK